AHPAPQLRHAPAGRRLRPARGPGDARPRRHRHHPDVHAPLRRPPQTGLLRRPSAGEGRGTAVGWLPMRLKGLSALLSLFFIFTTTPAMAKDVVLRPSLPSDRVVVILHGSAGHASEITRTAQSVFLATGFAVAASDADGPQNWGNPASVADNEHLISHLRRVGYTRVFLLAGSMGG